MTKEELKTIINLFLALEEEANKKLAKKGKVYPFSYSSYLNGLIFGYRFCAMYLQQQL